MEQTIEEDLIANVTHAVDEPQEVMLLKDLLKENAVKEAAGPEPQQGPGQVEAPGFMLRCFHQDLPWSRCSSNSSIQRSLHQARRQICSLQLRLAEPEDGSTIQRPRYAGGWKWLTGMRRKDRPHGSGGGSRHPQKFTCNAASIRTASDSVASRSVRTLPTNRRERRLRRQKLHLASGWRAAAIPNPFPETCQPAAGPISVSARA